MVVRRIKLVILPTAKTDLSEIVDFIARGSKKYARIEKVFILEAISKLLDNPFLGKPFDHEGIETRQLVFRNYLIIYKLGAEDLIEILTVHHHARSLSNNPAFPEED